MKIGCVVLAAGRGERFGGNKLLAPLAGKPLLAHTLAALPAGRFAGITAVVSTRETRELCRSHGVETVLYGGGAQSDSIRLGVGAMGGMDACLFVMGDQPLCGRDSICRMLDAFLARPAHIYRLAYGGVQSSPVLFPADTFSALAALEGEQGGMAVARRYPGGVRLVEADHPAELWDADTPQALAELERFCTKEKE